MSDPQTANDQQNDAPRQAPPGYEFTQEIRFAVVMYGGASLAIYINGVAQELLRLVRATAPDGGPDSGRLHLADDELKGSERVYRRIGRMLRRGEAPDRGAGEDGDAPIRTRFVVDILTGTSAGGINAVYLAKALANDQNLDDLKKLWVTEGDIGSLINDDDSYGGLGLDKIDGEPWSLLNSRRMHLKLLQALRGMDAAKKPCPPGESPLVDDLDLFVTSTDMAGRVIQMRLADDVVSERRHRNVFHFRYRGGRADERDPNVNDFGPQYNSFLAFAARATSAHQAAFTPIRLEDVGPIARQHPQQSEYPHDHERLRAFYRDYLLHRGGQMKGPDQLAGEFSKVWFNDGGSLDNKPFTFVFTELPHRQAGASVDRKLLYVEPSPEHLEFARASEERPRIVQNAWGGLSTLPSYETIVEDLSRLLERNRLIERVRNITGAIEDDIKTRHGGRWPRPRGRKAMAKLRVADLVAEKGAAWGGYQRLRIAQVTDDLTLLVARAAGIDEGSDEYTAVRELVRYWRRARYDDHDPAKEPEIAFLFDYDLKWTTRRVRFVLRKLDELTCFDARAEKLARLTEQADIKVTWPGAGDAALRAELRAHLREARKGLSGVLGRLYAAERAFWAYREDVVPDRRAEDGGPAYLNPFRDDVDALGITVPMLIDYLRKNAAGREVFLREYLSDPAHRQSFDSLVGNVRDRFFEEIQESRKECYRLLRPRQVPGQLGPAESVPYILHFYYRFFEDFDQVTFPILYSTDVGEEMDAVEVFRVSPEDARAIVNEKEDKDRHGRPMLKLAGTTLSNFGAFFERKFRINDITWGRLDGAERIIAALVPGDAELRAELTREAHAAIIEEEAEAKVRLAEEQADEVFARLPESERRRGENAALHEKVKEAVALMRAGKDAGPALASIEAGAARLREGAPPPWRDFLEGFVTEFRPFSREFVTSPLRRADPVRAFKNWFEAQYEEGRKFTPRATRDTVVRAKRVLGAMLLGYFPEGGERKELRGLIEKGGKRVQVFTEAAVHPGGQAYGILRRSLKRNYVKSALVLAAGVAFCVWAVSELREHGGRAVWDAVLLVLGLGAVLSGLGWLGLTLLRHLAWRKLKGVVASVLPKGRDET